VRQTIADALDLLGGPVAQGRVTRSRDHRPWPMPRRLWVMAQTWIDLLFAHWPVEPDALRAVLPRTLTLDTRDGQGWIGVTPFGVRNLRVRATPPVPGLSSFPEINVRTYVTVGGRPGIYFLSLDAARPLAVAAARRAYRLPYFRASMGMTRERATISYNSRRVSPEAPAGAEFAAQYRPAGDTFRAAPGTLEHWLTERYCLYTTDDGGHPLRGEIHHPPWPLQPAEANIRTNTMAYQANLELDDKPLLHYARRQDVVFWRLQAVAIA
jgi:uncharacterized protein YqjF (DUF2071 family)